MGPVFQISDKGVVVLKAGMARIAASQSPAPVEALPRRLGMSIAVNLDHLSPLRASELAQVGSDRALGPEVAFGDQRHAGSEEAIDAEAKESRARVADPH